MPLAYSIPLNWPRRIPVTPQRQRSFANGFPSDLSLNDALRMLEEELAEAGIQRATLSSDVDNPGNDRLRRKLSEDSGVCLSFSVDREQYLIAIDRWYLMSHNIYALSLFIRSLRGTERWGVADMATLLMPFRANAQPVMAPASSGGESWRQELSLGEGATLEDAHAVYRSRAKRYGHDETMLTRLNLAIEEARKHLS